MNVFRGRQGKALNFQSVFEQKVEGEISKVKLAVASEDFAPFPTLVVVDKELPDGRTVDDKLLFYDVRGNLMSTKVLDPNTMNIDAQSENGNSVLISTIIRKGTKSVPGIVKKELFDATGQLHWTKVDSGDIIWTYFIANNGSAVKNAYLSGRLVFLDSQGQQINEVDIFKERLWSRGRFVIGSYSNDSRYFTVNACDDVGTTFPNKSGIILFDSQGRELWRYHTQGENASIIKISTANKIIVATSSTFENRDFTNRTTYLLNLQGILVRKVDNTLANDFQFTADGSYVAIIYDAGRRVSVLDANTGEQIFRYSSVGKGVAGQQKKIYSADFNAQKQLVGIITSNEIMALHLNHVPAWSKSIPISETDGGWYKRPVFKFSGNGDEFIAVTNTQVTKYKLSN